MQTPATECPLYVDLDGSLVATDTLWESLLLLARRAPWRLLAAVGWLFSGKAAFKRKLADRVVPEPEALPYRHEVVAFLEAERARGRRLVLATAADARIADSISRHLGLFVEVLASDGTRNLSGSGKARAIRDHSGGGPFAYLGDSRVDLPVWEASREVHIVAHRPGLLRALRERREPDRVFQVTAGGPRAWVQALRPHQWAKNLLVLVPLALTPTEIGDSAKQLAALIAFVAFSGVASAGYIVNDLFDLEADRKHPDKRKRPFASGALGIPTGLVLAAALAVGAFTLAAFGTPPAFVACLAVYLVATLAYSLYVKRQLLVDILWLAALYTLRVIAGSAAVGIDLTTWLLAFSLFIFLSLAYAKRYSELRLMESRQETHAAGRAYRVEDLDLVLMLGATSGYLSVLVMCLYINSESVKQLYQRVEALWFLVPLLLYWVSRIWFLAKRGELPGDPVAFAIRDPTSLATAGLMALVLAVALF